MQRAALLAGLALVGLLPAPASGSAVDWQPCPGDAVGARCGSVAVPLDRLAPSSGTLRVAFELYRHTDGGAPAQGTLVDLEGGPGFSATGSRASYLALDAPLRDRRDVLLVDDRGTGRSSVLECPAFARLITGYVFRAGRCADELGPVVDDYDTHAVADDLAAVLDALGIARVDLYGDSYGSYTAQAFAVRHPDRLRSLVLDGTYPLPGTDPALGDLAQATQRGLRLVCDRRPSCAARDSDPVTELSRLVALLRSHPVRTTGIDASGQRQLVLLDESSLAATLQDAFASISVYRDVLAAARSFEAGDPVPLARLVAENTGGRRASPARSFSEALYLAVTCHDYPQLWDPAAPLAVRARQLAAARADLPAGEFAPFSPLVWTSEPYEGATACLRWPGPSRPDPPAPPQAPYPAVPTLILNGDLDNITASSGARVVAARFPRSTFVETENTVHISALGDRDACAAPLVRRFVATLQAGDTSCARRIAEVRVVDRFPLVAADAEAADPAPGDASSTLARQAAAVAAATVADAVQRWAINYTGTDRGLRGGSFSYTGGDVVRFQLDEARFASDVAVSGSATWDTLHGPLVATVTARGPAGLAERLVLRWDVQAPLARATLDGTAGGAPLHATMLAP